MKDFYIVFLFLYAEGKLYPYGPAFDRVNPKEDEGVSPLIPAVVPLFGRNYSSIFVNNNGLLSFNVPLASTSPQDLPIATKGPFLAPFWADVNNEISGNIYYRLSKDSELLSRTQKQIHTYFQAESFSPNWVLVATWDKVSYNGSQTNKVNTFQAVLCTDENVTFIMFNYGDIQWTTGAQQGGDSQGLGGQPALAGGNSGYNAGYFKIPGSLTAAIININYSSNVNTPGRWAFKVDQAEATSPNVPAENVLYAYGPSVDNVNPKADDGVSPPIPAIVPLFGRNYSSIYVNNNGLLSFNVPLASTSPQSFPVATPGPLLAPFWADVDNSITGEIYYRLSKDSELLNKTQAQISSYFLKDSFTPHWVLVATWDKVSYYGSQTNKVNTFQAVLCSDEKETFIMFNYGDIQWTTGEQQGGDSQGLGGQPALAGGNSGYTVGYFTIPGSLTAAIINVTHTGNAIATGTWAYKVDPVNPTSPQLNADATTAPTSIPESPSLGSSTDARTTTGQTLTNNTSRAPDAATAPMSTPESPSLGSSTDTQTTTGQTSTNNTTRAPDQQRFFSVVVYSPISGLTLLAVVIFAILWVRRPTMRNKVACTPCVNK